MKKLDMPWHEVLSKKGFDSMTSSSFIGFIAWEKNNMFSKMGKEINDALLGYEGRVIAMDVHSTKYNNIGVIFVNKDIPEESTYDIFNAILDYEHEEVYDM